METIWSKESDTILRVGRSLEDIGVRNWALTREQTLIALDQFEAKGIAILGGDVYEIQREDLQLNYDNWYCDRKDSEPKSSFVYIEVSPKQENTLPTTNCIKTRSASSQSFPSLNHL